MLALKKALPNELMTVEKLRQHWFGGTQVPFWNYDPSQLTFGLEIEYFIGREEGGIIQLATKEQYLSIVEQLVDKYGYTDQFLNSPGRVSKNTEYGFIAIKPDFAWHILEIALPPRGRLDDLKRVIQSIFSEVDQALHHVNLQRLDLSCLPHIPQRIDVVDLDRLRGFVNPGTIYTEDTPFTELRIFPALIAATHVHVNCGNEQSLSLIPKMYDLEEEAQERFVRAKHFRGKEYKNVRTSLYDAVFGDGYLLKTRPAIIPNSLQRYAYSFNRSTKLFPHDKFFPARDMSYIRPTCQGTIEFRSACSYLDVDKLLEIVEFRRRQVLEAHDRVLQDASTRSK